MHSGQFTVLLDACVLYPAPVRDILLTFGDFGLYRPVWSSEIQDEWKRNLLANRPDLTKAQLDAVTRDMIKAFPAAEVDKYESLIPSVQLPDKDDRHVVAAAIRANADAIVTYNLADFPQKELGYFDIEPKHPDEFLVDIIGLDEDRGLEAFRSMVSRLENPPLTADHVLNTFVKLDLKETSTYLRKLILKESLE